MTGRSQAQRDAVRKAAEVSARNRAAAAEQRRARDERHAAQRAAGKPIGHHPDCACPACAPPEPTLSELVARRNQREADKAAKIARLEAELAILAGFDWRRGGAGHDYGGGQRANELQRVRRELIRLGGNENAGDAGVPRADLEAAWARIARPRYRRLQRENYRRSTQATRRTIATWERYARALNLPLEPLEAPAGDGVSGIAPRGLRDY